MAKQGWKHWDWQMGRERCRGCEHGHGERHEGAHEVQGHMRDMGYVGTMDDTGVGMACMWMRACTSHKGERPGMNVEEGVQSWRDHAHNTWCGQESACDGTGPGVDIEEDAWPWKEGDGETRLGQGHMQGGRAWWGCG